MNQEANVTNAMTQEKASTRTVLSTLWIFLLLNIFARDIHELGRPGMLEQMMTGVIDGVKITEGLMLIGGIMIEIPILMVLLSQILPFRISRGANIGAGILTTMIVVSTNLNPDLDNMFFLVIKIAALIGIVWVAWRWKD
jgi:hypothetical protein